MFNCVESHGIVFDANLHKFVELSSVAPRVTLFTSSEDTCILAYCNFTFILLRFGGCTVYLFLLIHCVPVHFYAFLSLDTSRFFHFERYHRFQERLGMEISAYKLLSKNYKDENVSQRIVLFDTITLKGGPPMYDSAC